jgi:uncharacterized protein YigE (DUF2233 family)
MKILKISAVVFVLGVASFFVLSPFLNKQKQETSQESSSEVLGIPAEEEGIEIKLETRKFRAQFVIMENAQDISLLPNFDKKETSQKLKEESQCKALVNGGFYASEGYPTGLFITQGIQLKGFVTASLTNAVYSINDFETPRITRSTPQDHLSVALQAGPLLIENDMLLNLVGSDEEARRVVVGVTGRNESVFIVIYDPASVFLGPKLEQLPLALEEFEKNSGIDLADAMNLDGGSASSFISQDVTLLELSPIGSYFCIK